MVELCKATPFDHARFVFSVALLMFSSIVTSYAIFQEKTSFGDEVSGSAAFVIFIVALTILGIVEGLQIALVELKRQHPESYRKSHPRAYNIGQVASKADNVERFLMGRQVIVVFIVYFIAKLTTVKLQDLNDFLFPVPRWLYASLLETGFITCILVVIVAQLMPQIVASKYPVHFLDFWLMKPAYYVCVAVETTGITHACWILSHIMGLIAGMRSESSVLQNISSTKDIFMTSLKDIEAVEDDKGVTPLEGTIVTSQTALKGIENILNEASQIEVDETKNIVGSSEASALRNKFNHLVATLDNEVDPDIRRILQFYLDNHPEEFRKFPSVIGNKVYRPPQDLAAAIKSSGSEVPGFLRDISDPNHVPPHIVACQLLVHIIQLQNELRELRHEQSSNSVVLKVGDIAPLGAKDIQ